MAEALVEFDYKAKEPDELTIKKGDIITDISFKTGGWWEGTITRGGKRGMFPDNFVKLISDPDGNASSHQSSTGRKCKVLFNYKPANEDELELQVGDMIDIISEVEIGWWRGKLKNRVGVFPSNFVAEIVDDKDIREASQRKHKTSHEETAKTSLVQSHLSSSNSHSSMTISKATTESTTHDLPLLPPKPVKELCKAVFNYEAANADELTLQEGDVITLLTREGQDPGWWKGELKGKIGVFPDNFVQVITPSDDVAKPDRPSKIVSTTNKARETITKSATATSMSSVTSISRKFSDTNKTDLSKLEEKLNHPSLSKKPVLPPPPMKKPQRSSSDLAKSPTAPNLLSSKMLDVSPTGLRSGSNVTTSVKHTNSVSEGTNNLSSSSTTKWGVTEAASDIADGALWSKQGSYTVTSMESNIVSVNSSGNSHSPAEPDLDMVGRAAMLTHPTASRVKAPKRRPPSTFIKEEMKNGEEEEELTETITLTTSSSTSISHSTTMITSSLSSSSSSTVRTSTTMVNGDAYSHGDKPTVKAPWVKELELNQAKKSMQAGKTRVMIGGDNVTTAPTAITATAPLVTSPSGGSATTSTGSPTAAASAMSPENKPGQAPMGVTLRSHQGSSSAGAQRPQSMVCSLKFPLNNAASGDQSSNTITISAKQFNELIDKVAKLEIHFESQINTLTRTVKELTGKLDEERLRRVVMQQELEKLTDLVTQV